MPRASLPEFADSLVRYIGALSNDPAETFRAPFVVEFAGMPNAGKSLCVDRLSSLLRRAGFACRTIPEQAAISPIPDAKDPLFNLWTSVVTLANLLEARESTADVVVVDRGVTDALFWFEWLRSQRAIAPDDHETIARFLGMAWWRQTGLTFVLTTTPTTAMKRDYTDHLMPTGGGIMNRGTLAQFQKAIDRTLMRKERRSRIVAIDTTRLSPDRLIEQIFHESLLGLSDSMDERVFAVPMAVVEDVGLKPGLTTADAAVAKIIESIRTAGSFRRRSEVEESDSLVQPIPLAYFEHGKRLLIFRRKDASPRDRLFNLYTIWVGGHVRDRDRVASQRDLLVAGLRREISEELNIKAVPKPARSGIVWDTSNPRSRRHLGIAYRVALKSDAVSIRPDQGELRLSRGASISGTFQSRAQLRSYVHKMEPWSRLLIEWWLAS